MIKFPLTELLDEQACYEWLLEILHPKGLYCPNGHAIPVGQAPHDRQRTPIVKYKCRECGKVFHIFTGTDLSGSHYTCGQIVLILRGFLQGQTTQHIAEELGLDYGTLLSWRHRIQRRGFAHLINGNLPDAEAEMDEMFQNAAEKGAKKKDPIADPPRRRGNQRKGKGTMANDRPPVVGTVGRNSGQIRMKVCDNTQQITIQPQVEITTLPNTTVYTDESDAYNRIPDSGRERQTVCHSQREYARDDDQDGFCEVHCNTMEGFWVGLRNFLRPFRGIHKKYLYLYVAMFEWSYNLRWIDFDFLRRLLFPPSTYFPCI
jgi:transposase-like protein